MSYDHCSILSGAWFRSLGTTSNAPIVDVTHCPSADAAGRAGARRDGTSTTDSATGSAYVIYWPILLKKSPV